MSGVVVWGGMQLGMQLGVQLRGATGAAARLQVSAAALWLRSCVGCPICQCQDPAPVCLCAPARRRGPEEPL